MQGPGRHGGESPMIEPYAGSSPVEKQRRRVVAALLAVLLAAIEISIDWSTWVELNVSIMYGLPLVLAALAGSRRLLWALMFILLVISFAVYPAQFQAALFPFREPLFVNRVLS